MVGRKSFLFYFLIGWEHQSFPNYQKSFSANGGCLKVWGCTWHRACTCYVSIPHLVGLQVALQTQQNRHIPPPHPVSPGLQAERHPQQVLLPLLLSFREIFNQSWHLTPWCTQWVGTLLLWCAPKQTLVHLATMLGVFWCIVSFLGSYFIWSTFK